MLLIDFNVVLGVTPHKIEQQSYKCCVTFHKGKTITDEVVLLKVIAVMKAVFIEVFDYPSLENLET